MKTLGALCGAVTLILLALTPGAVAADRVDYALPSLATQEALRDSTLERRIEQLLPSLNRPDRLRPFRQRLQTIS